MLRDYLGVAISHLANTIFKTGIYPSVLKTARVLPLKKSGKPSDNLNSFRPINNLCPIDKIIEETLRVRIDNHLKKHHIIPINTHGAREAHSTTTALLQIERTLKANKTEGKTSVVIATDLTAAYDVIDHCLLLEKFEHIGLRGIPYQIIQSYLTDRHQFIDVQGYFSPIYKCRPYSVVQGGKFSGQFFQVYTLEMTKIDKAINNTIGTCN